MSIGLLGPPKNNKQIKPQQNGRECARFKFPFFPRRGGRGADGVILGANAPTYPYPPAVPPDPFPVGRGEKTRGKCPAHFHLHLSRCSLGKSGLITNTCRGRGGALHRQDGLTYNFFIAETSISTMDAPFLSTSPHIST